MIATFWGKQISDWIDIYRLLIFRGSEVKSFANLLAWEPPKTPQECVNLAFDLAEARALNYDIPVQKWIANILAHDRSDHTDVDNAPRMEIEP